MKNQMIKQFLKVAVVALAVAAMTQNVSAIGRPLVPSAPDAASSAGLLSLACASLAALRKFRR